MFEIGSWDKKRLKLSEEPSNRTTYLSIQKSRIMAKLDSNETLWKREICLDSNELDNELLNWDLPMHRRRASTSDALIIKKPRNIIVSLNEVRHSNERFMYF